MLGKDYLVKNSIRSLVFSLCSIALGFLFVMQTNSFAENIQDTTWQEDYSYYANYNTGYIYLNEFKGQGESYDITLPSKAIIEGHEYTTLIGYSQPLFPKDNIVSFSTESGVVIEQGCNLFRTLYGHDRTKLKNVNLSNTVINDASHLFEKCLGLESIELTDIDLSGASSMAYCFNGCINLKSVRLNIDISNITDLGNMFKECYELTNIDFLNFDTSNVENMSGLFSYCRSLKTINLSSLNTSNVTYMSEMFYNCSGLETIDLSMLDTSSVVNMESLFEGCSSLETINVSSLDTSSVVNMRMMFSRCSKLETIDLSTLDTSNVESMYYMFSECRALTSINLSNINTSRVRNMNNMFSWCGKSGFELLDLSSFDTSSVTDMGNMFYCCNPIYLDISSFDLSSVINYGDACCIAVKAVKTPKKTKESLRNMFTLSPEMKKIPEGESYSNLCEAPLCTWIYDYSYFNKSVTLTGGANATTSGGSTTQSYLTSAMTTVTYTANEGYYFEAFNDIVLHGVTIHRVSDTSVTVSGTPTEDVSLTVPNAGSLQTYSSVTLLGGTNATRSGGNTTQSNLTSEMTTVIYTAREGYYFEAFNDIVSHGVTIHRVSDTSVTISGAPTGSVCLTVPNAVSLQTISITATGYTGSYDGNPHTISVTVTTPSSGATIKYGITADNCILNEKPTITTTTQSPMIVFYKVTATGYYPIVGSATIIINKADIAVPAAPTKAGSTRTSITLTAHEGYEYRCDDGDWQTGNVFDDLAPGTTYNFYQRVTGDANHNSSGSSPVAKFKTIADSNNGNSDSSYENGESNVGYESTDNNGLNNGGNGGSNENSNEESIFDGDTLNVDSTSFEYATYGLSDKYVPIDYVDKSGSPMIIEGKENYTWNNSKGKSYWYEGGIKQGTYYDPKGVIGDGTNRGREIFDPVSNAWYWLDSLYDGAKAIGKEVWVPYIYQGEENWTVEKMRSMSYGSDSGMADCVYDALINKRGKWVRYDENGSMLKGWVTISGTLAELYPKQVGNTYYYDSITGLMAKGDVTIDGVSHHFNVITGVLEY